jgi:hypothetical protein
MNFELSFQRSFDASFRWSFEESDERSNTLSFEMSDARSDEASFELSDGRSYEVSFRVCFLRYFLANSDASFPKSFEERIEGSRIHGVKWRRAGSGSRSADENLRHLCNLRLVLPGPNGGR